MAATADALARADQIKALHDTDPEHEDLLVAIDEVPALAAEAAALRQRSDELNLELQGDLRPSEYEEVALLKRGVDEQAFHLEQSVRAIEGAHDRVREDAVSNIHFAWR